MDGYGISDAVATSYWLRVDKTGSHWLWTGPCDNHGYGRIWDGFKTVGAHQLAWRIEKGPIPEGLDVLHECDIPTCVTPTCLFLGTNLTNMKDMASKSRGRGPSKLTDDQVREVRKRHTEGESYLALSLVFGISEDAIRKMVTGKSHKWVR